MKASKALRSPLVTTLFVTVWVPLTWLFLAVIDIFLFADGRPQSFLARVFDDLVLLTSFFFFKNDWFLVPGARSFWQVMLPFVIQFSFWWAVAAGSLVLYRRLSAKK